MRGISAELTKAKHHRLLWILLAVMVLIEVLIIGGMRYGQHILLVPARLIMNNNKFMLLPLFPE